MRFTAELQQTGRTTTGFEVPAEVVEGLGGGRRPKVTVTVNGATYRSSVAPMGGSHWVGVSAENRALTGAVGGQTYDVDLELDTEPRVVEVPAELAEALASDPVAKAVWDTLSYSHQRQHTLAVDGAKAPETRARRVTKTLEALRSKG
ncbi:YdeI/OmpD-associated family protein [Pedococcus sp. KACC 23699]|uniref:YdeI/OmpD-associated family protein n=1 Tax=Pedococcus sp. KACC 23699 TaxID=3149228 RepID=A0AAU7JT04_9MICO